MWYRFFFSVFPLMLMWSLVNPMFAAPDEPWHIIRAQAAVRGQFGNITDSDGLPMHAVECMAFQAEVTADCMELEWTEGTVKVNTNVDTYPPLFHLLIGLPSLLFQGLTGAYIMRAWHAFLCSGLLAAGAVFFYQHFKSKFVIAGWALSITPAVLFLGGSVNSSGLASALAILLWIISLSIFSNSGEIQRKNITLLAVVVVVFLLVRRDSVLWFATILFCLIAINGLKLKRINARIHSYYLIAGALVSSAAVLITAVWLWPTYSGWLSADLSDSSHLTDGLSNSYLYLTQIIGWFGWMDTPLPEQGRVLSAVVLVPFIVLGFLIGEKGYKRAIFTAAGLTVLIPILIAEVRYPYFMGRYSLPLAVGVFLLSCLPFVGSRDEIGEKIYRYFPGALMIGWAFIHIYAFATNLRRNAVGLSGSWLDLGSASWHPPMFSNAFSLVLFLIAVACSICLIRPFFSSEFEDQDKKSLSRQAD